MIRMADFEAGLAGRRLAEQLKRPDVVQALEAASSAGEPAVSALDAWAARELAPLSDTEKQHAGRMVRDALTPLGWRVARRDRVRGWQMFRSGAVFERVASAEPVHEPTGPAPTARQRVDQALAILRAGRFGDPGTVDDFLAEKRAEALRESLA
jgi:hypothetical protein